MDVDTSLKNDNTLSYTVSPSKKDAVDIKGTDTVLDVTDLAVTNPKAVNVRAGQTNGKSVTAKLGVDSNSDRQLWAWEIPATSTKANEQSRITPVVDAEVAPWTIENDNCLPLVPSATTSKPIIADGTEYSTGITVANAEKDYQRLTGTVSIGGKTIKDAKVRVDASGKVYVTLPKGATGAVDNDKPVKVDVELSAQPREATKDSRYEAYNQPQVLRVAQDTPARPSPPRAAGPFGVCCRRPRCKNPHHAPVRPVATWGFPGAGVDFYKTDGPSATTRTRRPCATPAPGPGARARRGRGCCRRAATPSTPRWG